jgi:hypothetical protein
MYKQKHIQKVPPNKEEFFKFRHLSDESIRRLNAQRIKHQLSNIEETDIEKYGRTYRTY